LIVCECRGAPNTLGQKAYDSWEAASAASQDPQQVYAVLSRMNSDIYPSHNCLAKDHGLIEAQSIIDEKDSLYLMIAHQGQIVCGWPS